MTTGILGGTFDPPHLGHLNLALSALQSALVKRIIFIPTFSPPHKPGKGITAYTHRLKMTELLIESYPEFCVSAIEQKLQGTSYTINTLNELKKKSPQNKFRLIIGADMALSFGTWKDAESIIQAAPPLIAARPGYKFPDSFGISEPSQLSAVSRQKLRQGIFSAPEFNISSTELRQAISNNNQTIIEKYLDASVYNYINIHNIYK